MPDGAEARTNGPQEMTNDVHHFDLLLRPILPTFGTMEIKKAEKPGINYPRIKRHLIAWGIFLGFLGSALVSTELLEKGHLSLENFHRPLIFLVELLILVYASFFAYDTFMPKRQYSKMFLSFALTILAIATLDHYVNTTIIQIGIIKGFAANIVLLPFLLLIAFGIKWAYHGARQVFLIERLQAKQTESELKLLKSQVNPHFLFNTLNNIYSTNLDDHEKANDIILELADLLRYQLESSKTKFAALEDEIASLENYIALERIRVRDCKIKVEKQGDFSHAKLLPLLLLPFVENAFKYGTGIESGKINIRFEMSEDKLFHFSCRNKIVQKSGRIHSGGIGLQNVKKRLQLVYPEQHELQLKEEKGYYLADLKLKL